jgi:indole-3-glycerol phosphate synthase
MPGFRLRAAIAEARGFPLICEFKRASPSAGSLRSGQSVTPAVHRYAKAGAAAISVLTEPHRFQGGLADLVEARAAVDLPLLRKDFIVASWMVDEACVHGADAVLLIAGALPRDTLLACAARADELRLDIVLEIGSEAHLPVLELREWPLVGINARDLETLAVDPHRFGELAPRAAAPGRLLIAESGLATHADILRVRAAGAAAALVGEALMRAPAPEVLIHRWSGLS